MSRLQELWPDYWRCGEFGRVSQEYFDKVTPEQFARLDGKERHNLIRGLLELGATIALEHGPDGKAEQ